MLAWVMAQPHFHESARVEFQQVADGWLAAYAKPNGCTVVMLEEYDPVRRNKVPLVNVPGLRCGDDYSIRVAAPAGR
jgi:hypothetical protein